MRNTEPFVAYLDDLRKITVYLSGLYYQGTSNSFYLRDLRHDVIECRIMQRTNLDQGKTVCYELFTDRQPEIGKRYELVEEHGMTTPLQFALVTKTEAFAKQFVYPGDDLGAWVLDNKTQFNLWAPTASHVDVVVIDHHGRRLIPMMRTQYGVQRAEVEENLHGSLYYYQLDINGALVKSLDPYGIASVANHHANLVVDRSRVQMDAQKQKRHYSGKISDMVIMEVSVRDFSVDPYGQMPHPGTFDAMAATGTRTLGQTLSGLDYLADLGITHVQLMPVADFATVDEVHPQRSYNWGYDPLQYHVPEGSYTVDPDDGIARIRAFQNLVCAMHQKGLSVVMDVVYNHVYDRPSSSLEKTVPYYYFRYNEQGEASNGSFCGNDLDTQLPMVRKLILHGLKHWMQMYGVDGFRFDLMGIIDIETMHQAQKLCQSLDSKVVLYGEGWNMPTALRPGDKAMIANAGKLPGIGFFNDFFRDHVKGPSADDRMLEKGYLSGKLSEILPMKAALLGNSDPYFGSAPFISPQQSINYVECHDNLTAWDKLSQCCRELDKPTRIRIQQMLLMAVVLAQGVPFLQHGQEFLRTKRGYPNTFDQPDYINMIDWKRKEKYASIVTYTKALIALRKQYPVFRLCDVQTIKQTIYFEELDGVLLYQLKSKHNYQLIKVFFNPTARGMALSVSSDARILLDLAGRSYPVVQRSVYLEAYSSMVIGENKIKS